MRDEDEVEDDWKPIEGQLAKALPGQKINLRFNPPDGTTPTDFQWILPGTVFKDYTADKAKGELELMEAVDLNQQEVYFYWADTGTMIVKVTYKVDDEDRESEVTIEVEKPTATLTATGSDSVIADRPDSNPFRNLFVVSVDFTGSVTIPDSFGAGGHWSFVQLVTPKCSAKADPSQDDPSVSQDGGTYFDGGDYPYGGETFDLGADGTTYDDPGIPLRTNYEQYTADMSFKMYLMFMPPGNESRQVPLMRLDWSWSDAAIYDRSGLVPEWTKMPDQRDPEVEVGTAVEDTTHPTWTDSSDNHEGMN